MRDEIKLIAVATTGSEARKVLLSSSGKAYVKVMHMYGYEGKG